MSELIVNLSAVDVRVTEIKSPFPLFVLDWLNNSDELEAMEIRLSDFYHEGRFSTVLANFKFENMAKFLLWYESPKTQEVVAVLREMTKQKRLDIEILTSREEQESKDLDLAQPTAVRELSSKNASPQPAMVAHPSVTSTPEELPHVRPYLAEEQGSEGDVIPQEKTEQASVFTQRYF